MGKPLQTLTTALLAVLLVAGLLAACDSSEGEDRPTAPVQTPTATIPAVITRIVTPPPRTTPTQTPTPEYDLKSVAGRWVMRFMIEITGSSFAERLTYFSNADIIINLDGSVTGGGAFTANIYNPPCDARVEDAEPLRYTLTGATRPVGDEIWIEMTLEPTQRIQPENFVLYCPSFGDVRRLTQPVLWPTLDDLERLRWSFPLAADGTLDFEANLSQLNAGPLDGALQAEVDFRRN